MESVILRMKGVTKRFPGVTALDHVDFELKKGEIHALVGANGAGKSTLIKVLAGAYQPDEGTIELRQQVQRFSNPMDARRQGISVIYQEFTLVPYVDVAKNIFFGHEPTHGPFHLINWEAVYRQAGELLRDLGIDLDVRAKAYTLSVAEQQMVEIAKALSHHADVLVMDEPTAALTTTEVEKLFDIVAGLKAKGVSIIYISHRLEEVLAISDRLTVLRNGTAVGTLQTADADKATIVQMMVGKQMNQLTYRRPAAKGEPVLEVSNLRTPGALNGVSLKLHAGEVVGLAGLVGAGRTELARAIFGVDPVSAGDIFVRGRKVRIDSPSAAIRNGIGLLPESRKTQGLFMNLNVRRNVTFASLGKFSSGPFVKVDKERYAVSGYMEQLDIKTPSTEAQVFNLSGGNQQKVVLSKWLCTDSVVLILDELTRGVDVGAKEEMFKLIDELARQGKAIIFISSELEEVLRVSDRILTMYKGRITGELSQQEATMEKVMYLITGGEGH